MEILNRWRLARMFQSTPPRRGDTSSTSIISMHFGFNPRPREGATSGHGRRWGRRRGFNPRPREGATSLMTMNLMTMNSFQSTPPRRGDCSQSAPPST